MTAGRLNHPWPFEPLRPLSFDFIMADPPWLYKMRSKKGEAKSPQAHYKCMTDEEIYDLPIGMLARGDAALMLWATAPKLDVAMRAMKIYGFTYKTFGVWDKKRWGTGYIHRSVAEIYLIGTVGRPSFNGAGVPNLIRETARENSRKPEIAYTTAERLMPHAFRLDLFSRQTRPGWVNWGDESTKFDPPTDLPQAVY